MHKICLPIILQRFQSWMTHVRYFSRRENKRHFLSWNCLVTWLTSATTEISFCTASQKGNDVFSHREKYLTCVIQLWKRCKWPCCTRISPKPISIHQKCYEVRSFWCVCLGETRYGLVRCTCRYGGFTAVDGGTDSQLCSKHTAVADQTVCKYDRSLPRYTFSLTGYPEIAHIYRPQIALKSPKNLTDSHFSWEKLQISFFWRFRAKSRLWLAATVFITITTYRRNVWNWHFL